MNPRLSAARPRRLAAALAVALAVGSLAAAAQAHSKGAASSGGSYRRTNLVSDQPGRARITDPNLVNAWGLSALPTSPIWVADNGTDVSTLYAGAVHGSPPAIVPLVVSIPGGAPTGTVANSGKGFVIGHGSSAAPALFLFASEAGRITAWNPGPGPSPSTHAVTVARVSGAIYKGLALARAAHGAHIYAADFHDARIDVWDSKFRRVWRHRFRDPNIPAGFAPFNIQRVDGWLLVSYAKQDAAAEDDVSGPGHGFVDAFTPNGHLVKRLISHGVLNSPWGLVRAPQGFGRFSGDLLVGNFGNGTIHAFNLGSGKLLGTLMTHGHPISIDGLWALRFGNGTFGDAHTLIFSAGPDDESHGLLGSIRAVR
jgi:uncharacterized protein (TIGR03118 family)